MKTTIYKHKKSDFKTIKKLALISILLIVLIGCSKSSSDEVVNNIPPQLIGKWQFVEAYGDVPEIDINGNAIPILITNGYIVEYKADGTFDSDQESGYSGGIYSIISGTLGSNIKLTYTNGSSHLVKYQGIIAIENNNLHNTFELNVPYDFIFQIEGSQRLQKVIDQQTVSGKK